MNVHFLTKEEDDNIALLQPMLDDTICLTAGLQISDPSGCQVLIGGRPSQQQLASCPQLHTLIIPFAGLPAETRLACLRHPQLHVYNLHHNAHITAELAMALLFAAAKSVVLHDQQLRQGDWRLRYQNPPQAILLSGKRALIVGYGHVGQRVAQMCHAIGMRVAALQRTQAINISEGGVRLAKSKQLKELLTETDVLILACPLTDETRGLIGSEELDLMPPGGVLINIARGEVVDQQALFERLQSGHLAAAGLDVWYHYPSDDQARINTPPADFPFHQLNQVIMSPHRGGLVRETELMRMAHLAELLNSLVRGEVLPKALDVEAGY